MVEQQRIAETSGSGENRIRSSSKNSVEASDSVGGYINNRSTTSGSCVGRGNDELCRSSREEQVDHVLLSACSGGDCEV